MRKQLSMKRLHMLAANYLIAMGSIPKGKEDDYQYKANQDYILSHIQPELMDFIKYVWEHKDDDDLYTLPKLPPKWKMAILNEIQ